MQKLKDGFCKVWGWFLDGVDVVAGWIERHPKTTLGLIVCYLVVRR